MTILIIVAVILLVLLMGGLLAWLFTKADSVVTGTKQHMVAEQQAYNPAITMGHEIKVASDYPAQMKQARLEAAKTAAALPRGGNFGIGSEGNVLVMTASQGLADDPMTAVRIAQFHGWDGARNGIPVGGVPASVANAPAAVAAAPAATGEIEVVAGRDYQEIAITADMPPEEVRKARVANAKARSAALKAAKSAPSGAAPVAAAGVVAAAVAAPSSVGIEPPKLIEITEGMAPEDVRKARVANAKAEAAYSKAMKAAGATAGTVAAPVAAAAPVAVAAAPTMSVGIAPPHLIEITDSMAPEDIRKARVDNAKAQSAYNKALKEAGIDPSAVSAAAVEAPQAAAPVAAAVVETVAAPVASSGPTPEAMGIARPQLVEITDAMTPDQVRRTRVENAKAQSAYNKALKAAGIDPASVK